jgi:hypothetical protein
MMAGARLAFGMFAIPFFSRGLSAQPDRTFVVASIEPSGGGVGGGYPTLAPEGRRFTATVLR